MWKTVFCSVLLAAGAVLTGMAQQQVEPLPTAETAGAREMRRSVSGQVVTSSQDPAVTIEFDKSFKYVAGERFDLYGVADAEIHIVVDAGPDKQVRRAYWVQFEEYYPQNTHKYEYEDAEGRVTEGGLPFYTDTTVREETATPRSNSDTQHFRDILKANGYTPLREIQGIRLVHLTDAGKRKELMIIYMEAPAEGMRAADLNEGGRHAGRWPEIKAEITRHALEGMKITPKK